MTPTEDLFRLIKSLSGAEKRYFKLNASLYVREKIYMQLFELIDSEEEYREEKIKAQMNVAQFPVLKSRLFHLIMKCMATLYKEKCADAQLHEMLIQSQFLRLKGLDDASVRLLNRCRNRAMDCGRIEIALEALRMIPQHCITGQQFSSLENQGEVLLTRLQKQIAFKTLLRSVLDFFFEKGSIRCEEDLEICAGFLNHPLLKEFPSRDPDQRFYYHVIRTSVFLLLGNYGNARFELRMIEGMKKEKNNSFGKRKEKTILRLEIMTDILDKDFGNIPHKLKLLEHDSSDTMDQLFHQFLLLNYYYCNRNLNEFNAVLNGTEEIIQPFLLREKIPPLVQNIILKLIQLSVICGDYKSANRYIDFILRTVTNYKSTLHLQVCQLQILIHAVEGNKIFIDSLIKSFVRKINASNRYFASETLFVSCIRRCYLSSKEASGKRLQEYKTGFHLFREQFFERSYLRDIPVEQWIEQRVEELSKKISH